MICIVLQLLLQAVLARLLIPEEFGFVAVLSVFTAFFSIFSDIGISPAIIQFDKLNRKEYGNIFCFCIVLGICLTIVFCIIGLIAAWFYKESYYRQLFVVSSFSVFFTTLNSVPNGLLLKKRAFLSISLRQVIVNLIAVTAAFVAAFNGAGCYALILQSFLVALLIFLWNYCSVRTEIAPCKGGMCRTLKTIYKYSSFQLLWGIINYFSRNLDNLLIAKYMGSASLGYYDRAYKLTTYPVTNISTVITSALQPFLSAYKNDYETLFRKYLNIAKVMSLVAVYIAAICYHCSDEIVIIFYGNQWTESIPIFKVLSLSLYFQMVDNLITPVLQSSGRTDILLYSGGISTLITVVGIVVGILTRDTLMLASFVSIAYSLHFFVYALFVVCKLFKYPFAKYLGKFLPEMGFFILTIIAINFVKGAFSSQLNAIPLLTVKIVSISFIYFVVMTLSKQIIYIRKVLSKKNAD